MTEWQEVLDHLGVTDEQFNADLAARIREGYAEHRQNRYAEIKPSEIHGNGAFAIQDVPASDYTLVVMAYHQLTREGAAVNHSRDPNCELVHTPSGYLFLRALRNIKIAEELTHDYRKPSWSPK